MLQLISLLSFSTALLRDVIFSWSFGLSNASDTFWISLTLPVVAEVIFGGPLRDYIIRVTIKYTSNKIDIGKYVFLGVLLSSVTIVWPAAYLSDHVLKFIAPGWSDVDVNNSKSIFYIALFIIPINIAYYIQTGFSAAHDRFAWCHSRSVLINVTIAISCLIMPGSLQYTISAYVIGCFVHLIIAQCICIKIDKLSFNLNSSIELKNSTTMLAVVMIIIGLLLQLIFVLEKAFATEIGSGSVTTLSMAYRIATIPVSLGVASLIVPYYVRLERTFHSDEKTFVDILWVMCEKTLWFILPAVVILFIFADELCGLIFVRGQFSQNDAKELSSVIKIYALGIPFFAISTLLSKALIASGKFKFHFALSTLCVIFYYFMCYGLEDSLSLSLLALLLDCIFLIFVLIAAHKIFIINNSKISQVIKSSPQLFYLILFAGVCLFLHKFLLNNDLYISVTITAVWFSVYLFHWYGYFLTRK